MALSDPRVVFGIHSVTPYNLSSGEFYGIVKILGGSSLALTGALIKLNGGSFKYPWAVEDGNISAEMTWKVKEYPSFLFTLFLGNAPTDTAVDAAGSTSTLTNRSGTSVKSATTGITSVAVIPSTGAANLKFGKYVVKAASATTVNIYMSTDIDHLHGTDETFDSDILLVDGPETITASTNTDVASLGLRFAGGSGTIGMTTGDTATFFVEPPTTKSMNVIIGAVTDQFPEFGCLLVAKKRTLSTTAGEYFELDAMRCKGIGLPLAMEENAFSTAEIKVECFYNSNPVFQSAPGVIAISHQTVS